MGILHERIRPGRAQQIAVVSVIRAVFLDC
jgi:hypothetical protein